MNQVRLLPTPARISRNQTSALGHRTCGNPPTFRVSDVGAGPCFGRHRHKYTATVVGHPLSHHRRQSFSAALTIHYLSLQRRQTSTASATVRILTHHRCKTIAGGPYGTSAAQSNEHQMRHQPRHQPHLSTRPYRVITSINTMTHRHIRLQPNNRRPIASD